MSICQAVGGECLCSFAARGLKVSRNFKLESLLTLFKAQSKLYVNECMTCTSMTQVIYGKTDSENWGHIMSF